MIKKLFFILLFLSEVLLSFAQDGKNQPSWDQRKRQFKSEKIAYISTEMNFTVEEAQKFWPLYNKYDEIFDQIGEKISGQKVPVLILLLRLSALRCWK